MLTRCPSCNKILSGFFEFKIKRDWGKLDKVPCPHCATILTYDKEVYKRSLILKFIPLVLFPLVIFLNLPSILTWILYGIALISFIFEVKLKPKLIIHSDKDNGY